MHQNEAEWPRPTGHQRKPKGTNWTKSDQCKQKVANVSTGWLDKMKLVNDSEINLSDSLGSQLNESSNTEAEGQPWTDKSYIIRQAPALLYVCVDVSTCAPDISHITATLDSPSVLSNPAQQPGASCHIQERALQTISGSLYKITIKKNKQWQCLLLSLSKHYLNISCRLASYYNMCEGIFARVIGPSFSPGWTLTTGLCIFSVPHGQA